MISSIEAPTRTAGMSRANADIILAIYHLKSNLQFPVECRHVYGHQDGKNKKKQEKREKESEEEMEGFLYETEAESSESKAETAMTKIFQLGEARSLKRTQKVEQKKDTGPRQRRENEKEEADG